MTKILSLLHVLVWGAPALFLILGVGLYYSLRLGFPQLRYLPQAMGCLFGKLKGGGKDSSFRSLCTALGATVGTGNLVGVAGAICVGGPGAVFWMWVCGILGMVTKYAEAVLAVRYRVSSPEGYLSGPMYMITEGMGSRFRPLAVCYCLMGLAASFGIGNAVQIHAVRTGIGEVLRSLDLPVTRLTDLVIGLILGATVGIMLFGGAKRIADGAQRLVPFAAVSYILMCLVVLLLRWDRLGGAFSRILLGAWEPKAVTGGAIGSAFQTLRVGCSRGTFTNEAGMGTAAIAHGSAEVSHPVEQGLMGIVEVFLDTIVICTLTALVILVSGVPIAYGVDTGAELTLNAFAGVYRNGAKYLLTAMLACFAIATLLGWGLYGARCAQFLFGSGAWPYFAAAQTLSALFSTVVSTAQLWQLAEIQNALMLFPNLIALVALSPEVIRLTKEYRKNRSQPAGGGNYANIHQCKPLCPLSHAEVPSPGGGGGEGRQENLPPEHWSAGSSHASRLL